MKRSPLVPTIDSGSIGDVIRLLGCPLPERQAEDRVRLTQWRVRHDATLIHEGSQGQVLYVLRKGSLKCVKTLEDGYEQVLFFAHPGELLGFEALHNGIQPASVIALEDAALYALPLCDLRRYQSTFPNLRDALQHALSRQLARAAETAEMMAAVASEVRLARFLLAWSARAVEAGCSPTRLHFSMGRRDIASLLGVAHETVSRSFTMLSDAGCLRVDNREVEILDLHTLRARAMSTRGVAPVQAVAAHTPARRVGHDGADKPAQAKSWHASLLALQDA